MMSPESTQDLDNAAAMSVSGQYHVAHVHYAVVHILSLQPVTPV